MIIKYFTELFFPTFILLLKWEVHRHLDVINQLCCPTWKVYFNLIIYLQLRTSSKETHITDLSVSCVSFEKKNIRNTRVMHFLSSKNLAHWCRKVSFYVLTACETLFVQKHMKETGFDCIDIPNIDYLFSSKWFVYTFPLTSINSSILGHFIFYFKQKWWVYGNL